MLLVLEPQNQQFYCPALTARVASKIIESGGIVTKVYPDITAQQADFPDAIRTAMRATEHTIFFNRIGDYARFVGMTGAGSKTICYARNGGMMNSPFAGMRYTLMTTLLEKLEAELLHAARWKIECDLGTDIAGSFYWRSHEHDQHGVDDDFSMTLFPVTTFKPVLCHDATGVVALSRWLMPAAAVKVGPDALDFCGVVKAIVNNGYLEQFDGEPEAAQKISDYYDLVSAKLQVNRNRIHSWHAGINPLTSFGRNIEQDFEGWCSISFASPRYLHFHTCGDQPPGEIAWSVFNPSVSIDGERFWHNGQFVWLQRQDNVELIGQYPAAARLLEASSDIGV